MPVNNPRSARFSILSFRSARWQKWASALPFPLGIDERPYWNRIGQFCYPDADSILLLLDCGGSNAVNKYIFKHDLQEVVNSIGFEIRVAHYPSYCSKYNPIERRFFPHVTRACTGMLFDTLQTAVDLMRNASTTTGLRTTVNDIRRLYETGRTITDAMKKRIQSIIVSDKFLPKRPRRNKLFNSKVVHTPCAVKHGRHTERL